MDRGSQAVEDYLKTLFHLTAEGEGATTSQVADRLGVSSPSVSGMCKRLEGDGLVHRTDAGWRLTDTGERAAERVVRRHRLLETFLVEVLGYSWDEVHDEAERLEHVISDRLEDRIDVLLGRPTHDPHGDPIPALDGAHVERRGTPLLEATTGGRFLVERVADAPEALRFLAAAGIRPGVEITLTRRDPFGGPLWLDVDGTEVAIGPQLADMVSGRPIPGTPRPPAG